MINLLSSFTSILSLFGRILLALVILMFMVLIHETGHYTAGKIFGFKINEFAIGMGPKILSRTKKNGEVISLRLLPLGGFCAFEGENEDGGANPDAFNSQKAWKRLIVLFAGAFFNFVSAILICIIAFGCYGDNVAVVNRVYDYAPSVNQQLSEGDILYKIDGRRVFVLDDVGRYMDSDKEMSFEVLRKYTDENGNVEYKKVLLENGLVRQEYVSSVVNIADGEYVSTEGERKLASGDTVYKLNGVSLYYEGAFKSVLETCDDKCVLSVVGADNVVYEYRIDKSDFAEGKIVPHESAYSGIGMSISYATYKFGFGEVLARVFPYCGEVAMLVLRTLGGLITGVVGIDQVGGPITTISMTSQIVATGFGNILRLIVLISVNLAVFNLLPVPALDGCQMLFVIIEWIARKPVNRKVQAYINGIGLVVLIILMVLIDILKL